MVRLGDICEIQSGGTPARSKRDYWENGTIPWVKISDIKGKHLENTEEFITDEGLKNSSAKVFPKGTILYTIFATLGETCILDIDAATNQAIAGITIKCDGVYREYLYYYLSSLKSEVNQMGRGVAQNNINMSILRNLPIQLPPLDEQHRIAATLDKVSDLISKRRQQLDKLDELVKARFVEMFGDLTANHVGWEFTPLSKLCDVRDGTHDSPQYLESGYPLLTSKNFTSGEVDFTDCNFISQEDFDKINQRSKVDVGDIVMPMIGTIGSPVIVNTEREFAIKNVALIKFEKSQISNIFVKQILNSDYFKQKTFSSNRGGTQKFIALGDIRKLPIPVVPIELQTQFDNFVKQTDKTKVSISRSLEKLETLKKALMQEYFGT